MLIHPTFRLCSALFGSVLLSLVLLVSVIVGPLVHPTFRLCSALFGSVLMSLVLLVSVIVGPLPWFTALPLNYGFSAAECRRAAFPFSAASAAVSLCFALHCSALLCFALLCSALLCFALL